MTVAELIEMLQNEDPTKTVIIASDAEWNGFNRNVYVESGYYDTEYNEVCIAEMSGADRENYTEVDVIPVIVLSP